MISLCPEITKQLLSKRENLTLRSFIEAIGDYAIALTVPPGLEAHTQPFCNALWIGRICMPQTEFIG